MDDIRGSWLNKAVSLTPEEEILKKKELDKAIRPTEAKTPPIAKTPSEQEKEHAADNPKQSWMGSVPNHWTSIAQADTRESILKEIVLAISSRYESDSALIGARAVTDAWIENQVKSFGLPLTEDDVRAAIRTDFETRGISIRK